MANEDPPATEPVFRRVDASEAESVLCVLQAAFDSWPPFDLDVPAIDHLRWKMSPPPPHARDLHAAVELDGEIVAVQMRWLSTAHVRGDLVASEFGIDFAVHPDARGRGLARLIRAKERDRIGHLRVVGYDTAVANEGVRHMQSTDGERTRRPLTVWVWAAGLRPFLGSHRPAGLAHLLASSVRGALNRLRTRTPSEAQSLVERIERFDQRADDLWERFHPQFQLARRRDAAWLNWRYLDPRAGQIAVHGTYEGDQLLGYVAARQGRPQARILDLVADPARPEVAATLLHAAIAQLRTTGASSVLCLLPPAHPAEPALRLTGFLPTGQTRSLDFERRRHAHVPEILEIAEDPTAPIHAMLGEFDHG